MYGQWTDNPTRLGVNCYLPAPSRGIRRPSGERHRSGARRPSVSGGGAGLLPQVLLALLCGGYAAGAALGWGSPELALFMGDFGLSAAALAAAVSCLWYGRTRSGRLRPAWLLFAASAFMAALGNGVWGWYEVVLGRAVPSPSPADFCFLLFAPPAIVGMLVLAKRPVTRAGWICLALDAWLIAGSLLTLSWSLALAHAAQFGGGGEPVARRAFSLAYPLLDIVLISMVVTVHFRRSSANRSAINTAIAAFALTVLCDALFTSPLLREHYRSGQILDAGWFAGSILLAYAPWVARREAAQAPPAAALRRPAQTSRAGGSLAALAPYLAAAVCTLGILYNVMDGRPIDGVMLFTACAVVLALVVRQAIMLLDNITLTQELAEKENHFRSLVQSSSDVIMIAAPTGILRYVSPAASGVYGREADELVGSELASLIHPEDLGSVVHEVRRFLAALAGGGAHHPYRVPLPLRLRRLAQRGVDDQPPPRRPHLQQPGRHRAGAPAGPAPAQRRARPAHRPAQPLPVHPAGPPRAGRAAPHRRGHRRALHRPRRLQGCQRHRRPPGGRRAAGPGRPPAPGVRALRVRRLRGPARGRRVRRAHPRRRRPGRRRPRVPHPGDRRPAPRPALPALPGRGRHRGPGGRQHRRRLRRARHRPRRADAQRRPGDVPRQVRGKNRVELYAPQMQADVTRRAEFATRLRTALHDGEFVLLHQPVVELAGGRITAVGAQPRWRSAQGILFTPAEFLRVADSGRDSGRDGSRSGEAAARTAELARWTLEAAVEQAAERRRDGFPVPVCVRLPASRLVDKSMPPKSVETLLARHGLPSGALNQLGIRRRSAGAPAAAIVLWPVPPPLRRPMTSFQRAGRQAVPGQQGLDLVGGMDRSTSRLAPSRTHTRDRDPSRRRSAACSTAASSVQRPSSAVRAALAVSSLRRGWPRHARCRRPAGTRRA